MSILSRFRPHDRWAADLSAHLDGALSPARQQALLAHLAACVPCETRLAAYRSTREALRTLPPLQPARSFHLTPALLEAPVATAPAPAPRPILALRLAPALGVLAIIGFVTTLAADLTGGESTTRQSAATIDLAAASNAPQQPRAASAGQDAESASAPSSPLAPTTDQTQPSDSAATKAPISPVPLRPLAAVFAALAVAALAATVYSRRSDG